jgi:hypothetical protein
MFEAYNDIELDVDPIIVPPCGHIITVGSLDGHFNMSKHYDIQDGINISGISASSTAFSAQEDMKRCPTCRGSLKTIQRYARITRRALLDESTKRFIVWAQKDYLAYETQFSDVEDIFLDATRECLIKGRLDLTGHRAQIFRAITKVSGFKRVYLEAIDLRKSIEQYAKQISKEEQPYHRVRDMVEDARKRKKLLLQNIPDEIQTVEMRHTIQASALLLRFDILLLSKVVAVKQSTKRALTVKVHADQSPDIRLDLSSHRHDYKKLITDAANAKLSGLEADGHILFARYAALDLSIMHGAPDGNKHSGNVMNDAIEHLNAAEHVCELYPNQCKGRPVEIDTARKMLRGDFYTEVSNEERRAVVQAMAMEFRGSGHWVSLTLLALVRNSFANSFISTLARTDIHSLLGSVACRWRQHAVHSAILPLEGRTTQQ